MGPLEILANTPQFKDSYIKEQKKPISWKARLLKGGAPPAEANTNNRMELRAIIEGFRAMTPCTVTVLTDSQYAIGLLSRRNKVKKNRDLLSEFLAVSQGFSIVWKHIPGHGSGNPNVIADLVAGSEANEHRTGTEDKAG